MDNIKTSVRKLVSVLLCSTLSFSVLSVAFVQKAEAVASIRNDWRVTDQYGTPYWNGSEGEINWTRWTVGSNDYWQVNYPRHIYMDVSETLESAGYYQTYSWHYGNSGTYQCIPTGYVG